MARTPGAIGWKKQQAYLHEKFPEQGWMEETDKKLINENYKAVKASEGEGTITNVIDHNHLATW